MSWLGAPSAAPASSLRQRASQRPATAENGHGHGTSHRPRARRRKSAAPPLTAHGYVQEAFRLFGEHIARNQIRTLLIDCVIMTTLFYPTFSAFLERQFDEAAAPARAPAPGAVGAPRSPLSILSAPVGETFFPDPPPLLPNVPWGPWWAGDSRSDTAWVAANGPAPSPEGRIDVDLLRVAWADVGHVLDGVERAPWGQHDDLIASAIRTLAEGAWDGAGCVRHLVDVNGTAAAAGPCYLLAPDGVFIDGATPMSALWNLTENDDQVYRGVAVPFHTSRNRVAFEAEWIARLAQAVKLLDAEVFTETYPTGSNTVDSALIAYSPGARDIPYEPIPAKPPKLVYLLYVGLLALLLAQLSNASKVHSRFGLAFTGVVQLCCSAIMSFSVLALLGWNGWGWSKGQTVLPIYTLPFVVIIVGVENMSSLTKAVFSIPFSHSVPVRIGLGLRKVGTTIAITSLTDLALLGVTWLLFPLQQVREFCVFAAVVIVTDWFMLHTFFLTVLSIDAQRLELADVLSSNGGLSTVEEKKRNEEAQRRKASRPMRFQWRSFVKGRKTKGVTMIVIFSFIFILYYWSDSSRSSRTAAASFYGYQPTATTTSSYASPTKTAGLELGTLSVSEAFWRALNPRGFQSIRIGIPPSSIVILPRAGHSMLPADIRRLTAPSWTLRLPSLTPVWNIIRLIIIPQSATALTLYGLLLYLLKDSDLLASQRNRLGRGETASDDESDDGGGSTAKEMQFLSGKQPPMATGIGVHMLPASHEFDIDVIATSADGRLAVSVAVDNSICLWRFHPDDQASGTREMVPTELSSDDPIVGAAVSRDSMWVAVVTRCGRTEFWRTADEDKTERACVVKIGCGNGDVASVLFDDAPTPIDDPFAASPVSPTSGDVRRPTLLVVVTDGSVRALKDDDIVVDVVPPAKDEGPHTTDVFAEEGILDIIVRSLLTTTLWSRQRGEWSSMRLISSLAESDRVVAVGHALTRWRGYKVRLIALGHRSGNVEIIDTDGEMVTLLALSNDPIRAVDIGTPHSTRCTSCDIHSTEGFYVIASTSSTVYVDRIVSRTGGPFCRCAPARRAQALEDAKALIRASVVFPPMPVRSRCLSNGFSTFAATTMTTSPSAMGTPVKSSLAPPGDFQVSSHGGRRLSGWREENRPPSPLDRSGSFTGLNNMILPVEETATLAADSRWMDAGILPLGGVEASEGGWVLVDHVVVGLLRKGSGIDDSQWELWALDLASPWNGFILMAEAVSLDAIQRKTATSPRSPSTPLDAGELSMRTRRAERMLSMNGRASFPSSAGSFTVPTHQPLGYVSVRPFTSGGRAVLAGFGNRVGVLTLPPFKPAPPPTPAPKPAMAIGTPQRNGLPTPPPQQQPPPPPPPQLQVALPPRPPRRSQDVGSGNGNGSIMHSPAKIK
ncbi:uncharacterized protein CcaverHIS019_0507750 [Cutaneotrichosporon cavernicola]|uniref:Sterol regulatory element-binding protein cleavage-activating protein n=1 Tax=Cutaneotrichosporon cavernicola TaxID=279322 RepID=A0AA48L725_9TREE|nr:uncharacterized protein CcaverHIS019_0507750 [Cutaneotrichosporon cavernicola]BEI93147.1 hypothetical protein CcaverHIS019_0507750 [Cutaneotrichosporon cavernicola]BEJ00923.1 hypothetical protein CcaverHIS631_0507800 [Cutaneotrichosporon cavernicola]BEJ08689.1 hypothetical protein CcaverHIS641_0507830 [Cutaneotrichosporon cavernicola]